MVVISMTMMIKQHMFNYKDIAQLREHVAAMTSVICSPAQTHVPVVACYRCHMFELGNKLICHTCASPSNCYHCNTEARNLNKQHNLSASWCHPCGQTCTCTTTPKVQRCHPTHIPLIVSHDFCLCLIERASDMDTNCSFGLRLFTNNSHNNLTPTTTLKTHDTRQQPQQQHQHQHITTTSKTHNITTETQSAQ